MQALASTTLNRKEQIFLHTMPRHATPCHCFLFTDSYIPTSCGENNLNVPIKFINVPLLALPRPLPLELVSQAGLNPQVST